MFTNRLMPARAARFGTPAFFNPRWDLDWLLGDLSRIARAEPRAAASAFVPAVDIEQTDTELRVSAELPGLEAGDFEVTTEGNLLTIRGEKKFEFTSDENGRRRIERSSGSFERRFRIAWEVDPDTVKAVYRNGVLDLVIPKPEDEQSQVRTIPVTGS